MEKTREARWHDVDRSWELIVDGRRMTDDGRDDGDNTTWESFIFFIYPGWQLDLTIANMHSFIGIALLSNIASGLSCIAHVPPPTTSSAFLRNSLPSSLSRSTNTFGRVAFQQPCGGVFLSPPLMIRGGGGDGSSSARAASTLSGDDAVVGKDLNLTTGKVLASMWGSFGVVYILAKAIKRVVPIALEPFFSGDAVSLTRFQLA